MWNPSFTPLPSLTATACFAPLLYLLYPPINLDFALSPAVEPAMKPPPPPKRPAQPKAAPKPKKPAKRKYSSDSDDDDSDADGDDDDGSEEDFEEVVSMIILDCPLGAGC